jgi:hypothetical protein
MKKRILLMALVSSLLFTSCSSTNMRNTGEASVITGIIVLGIIVTPIVLIYKAVDDTEEGLKNRQQ